jgi:hypothetical protein
MLRHAYANAQKEKKKREMQWEMGEGGFRLLGRRCVTGTER